MTMVHTITRYGPLVTRNDFGFPNKEGWLNTKRDNGRSGADPFQLGDDSTSEFLSQARSPRKDCYAAMNDQIFIVWFKYRLVLASREHSRYTKIVSVRNSAPYHHRLDPGILVPEPNTKQANTQSLQGME